MGRTPLQAGTARIGRGRRHVVRRLALTAVLLAALVGGVATPPAGAAPGDAFDGSAAVFVAQGDPTQLYRAVPDAGGTVSFSSEGGPWDSTYNAIAYNPADDFIYAVQSGTVGGFERGAILRIGQGGVVTRVGTGVTDPPGANAGTFGPDGDYYVGSSGSTAMNRIDVSTGTVVDTYVLPDPTRAADLAYAFGAFWGVNADGELVRVTLDGPSPTVEFFPSPIPAAGYGAAWQYGNGNLGVSDNGTGQVTQFRIEDPATASPTVTIVATQPGPPNSRNDGTAAPGPDVDLSIVKEGPSSFGPGDVLEFTITVTNESATDASSGFVANDLVPAELENPTSPTPGCAVDGSTVTCTGGTLDPGESQQIVVRATAPDGFQDCVTNVATVLGNERDPQADNGTASVESCAVPRLEIDKSTTTTEVTEPGPVDYTITVTNTGAFLVEDIDVSDSLDDTVDCPSSTLAVGASMECAATYVVTQADIDAGDPIENLAAVTGTSPGGPVTPAEAPPVEVPIVQSPGVALAKSADPTTDLEAGDVVTYTFVATNTGNVTLDDVAITDPLDGLSALSCDLGAPVSLAPDAELTCTATYTVTQQDVDDGGVDNVATVTGTPPAGPPIDEDSPPVEVDIEPDPGIELAKTADPDEVTFAGDVITYTFVATNTGNVTLDDVAITDDLDGLSALACDAPVPATLVPGEDPLTCTATYEVTQADVEAGEVVNTATVEGTPPSGPPVSHEPPPVTVDIPPSPDVELVKTAEPASGVALGDVVTYTFVVSNTGNVDLTDVGITDELDGLSGLDCVPAIPAVLAPGEAVTCTATYTVTQEDVDAGGVVNSATASGTPPDGPPVTHTPPGVTVPIAPAPSLEVVKTADAPADPGLGDRIDYDLVATNTGNVTLSDVVVSDDRPGLFGMTCAPTSPVVLAPGEQVVCSATYEVTQSDVDAGEIVNVASAEGTSPDGGTVTGESPPVVVEVARVSALDLEKTAVDATFRAVGDVVEFEFLVTNTGTTTVTGIQIEDDLLDEPAACPATSLAPGAAMTCTGARAITAAEVTAGELVNVATATGVAADGEALGSAPDRAVAELDESAPLPRTGSDPVRWALLALVLVAAGRNLVRTRRVGPTRA